MNQRVKKMVRGGGEPDARARPGARQVTSGASSGSPAGVDGQETLRASQMPPPSRVVLAPGEMTRQRFAEHLGVSYLSLWKAQRTGILDPVTRLVRKGSRAEYIITDVARAVELWLSRPGSRAPALGRKYEKNAPPPQLLRPPSKDAPPEEGGDEYASQYSSRRKLDEYKARLARLDYEERSGQLVEAKKVVDIFMKRVTEAKTKLLAVAKHARSRIPHMTVDDVETVEDLIREALEGLAVETLDAPVAASDGEVDGEQGN